MLHNSQQSLTQSLVGNGRDLKTQKTLTKSIERANGGFSAVAGLNSSHGGLSSSIVARTRKAPASKAGESTPMRSGGSGKGHSERFSQQRPDEMSADSFSMKLRHQKDSDEESDYGEEVSQINQL